MRFYKKIYVILDLFSLRAWGRPSEGRNMSPWQYTIFNVYEINCVMDWRVYVFYISYIGLYKNVETSDLGCTIYQRTHLHAFSSWSLSSTKIASPVLHYRTLLCILPLVRDGYSTEFLLLGPTRSIEEFVFFSIQKFESCISHIRKTDQDIRCKL